MFFIAERSGLAALRSRVEARPPAEPVRRERLNLPWSPGAPLKNEMESSSTDDARFICKLWRNSSMFSLRGNAVQGLGPNDIIGTIGTLIGFFFTAYALLTNAKLDPSTFRIISALEYSILAFFILTAFGAAADKPQAFALALGIYPASWFALALGVGLIFLVIIAPQFPFGDYAPALAVVVAGSIIGVVAAINSVGIYRALETIRVEGLSASGPANAQARVPPQGATDFTAAFLTQASELESRLRELFLSINPQPVTDSAAKVVKTLHDKGKLSDDDYQTFRALWRLRNLVIHGNQVAQGDLV